MKAKLKMSPDGAWILYGSFPHTRGNSPEKVGSLMRLPASGGPPEKVWKVSWPQVVLIARQTPASSCVWNSWEQGQLIFYALDPVHGSGKELARTQAAQPATSNWRISPDGSRVAVYGGDLPREQFRIVDLRNSSERNVVLPHGWVLWSLSWATDGNALFVAAQSKATGYLIARVELDGKSSVLLDRGRDQWLGYPVASPDGRHLAFSQQTFDRQCLPAGELLTGAATGGGYCPIVSTTRNRARPLIICS